MGGFATLAGPQAAAQFKTVKCDGATYTGQAIRDAGDMQSMRMFICMYPYADGYSMQIYTVNTVNNVGGLDGIIQRGVEGAIGDGKVWGRRLVDGMISAVSDYPDTTVTYTEGSGGLSINGASEDA